MNRKLIKELTNEVLKRTDRVISEEELQGFIVDFLKEKKSVKIPSFLYF